MQASIFRAGGTVRYEGGTVEVEVEVEVEVPRTVEVEVELEVEVPPLPDLDSPLDASRLQGSLVIYLRTSPLQYCTSSGPLLYITVRSTVQYLTFQISGSRISPSEPSSCAGVNVLQMAGDSGSLTGHPCRCNYWSYSNS
jgi:hypothetical protein